MEWIESIREAINYIEENITEDLSIDEIAKRVNISPFYFQKGFSLLCGVTVSEYIRKRRLALAANDLALGDSKVIDIALKYGYDSPDSFTKAFTRFHGMTPAMARKEGTTLKSFAPLKISFSLKGGYLMDYKITQKASFTVLGAEKNFKYDTCKSEIPMFWQEHYKKGNGKYVCGMYGVNHDPDMGDNSFEYMIADNYNPVMDIPEGFTTMTIPAFTWAVFPCVGPVAEKLQELNRQIFSEWLPSCKEYEIAEGYCIELYSDAKEYKDGTNDKDYYCELWIPVKKKTK